jgi:hypothetical protein
MASFLLIICNSVFIILPSDTVYSELLIVDQKVGLVAKIVFSSTVEGEGRRLEHKADIYENFEKQLHRSAF